MKNFFRKFRVHTLAAGLTVYFTTMVSASSSAPASSEVTYYGSVGDYIWLIGGLLIAVIVVFRKLGQLNAKNAERERRTRSQLSNKRRVK